MSEKEGELQKILSEINIILRKPMIATSSGLITMRMEEQIELQNLIKRLEEKVDKAKKEFPLPKKDSEGNYEDPLTYAMQMMEWFVRWFGKE